MTADTTDPNYWLNWQVLVGTIWLFMSVVFALILIFKYEGPRKSQEGNGETEQDSPGVLWEDDVWRTSLKSIHPGVLLTYRALAFIMLLSMIIINFVGEGVEIFQFYTYWTIIMLMIYFGLGTLLSIRGCIQYHNAVGDGRSRSKVFDAEYGSYEASMDSENSHVSNTAKSLGYNDERLRQTAGFWGYVFQIIFQMLAGAVLLTDSVFWLIIVPFLNDDMKLDYMIVMLHSINAILLLGDTILNCLRFPWFRIAYFFLFTGVYVIFQWIIHAIASVLWPYAFLDLSDTFAPVWYFSVSMVHLPCYGFFVLITRIKHFLLSRLFPRSYQCP